MSALHGDEHLLHLCLLRLQVRLQQLHLLLLLLYLFKPDISRVALRIVLRRCSLSSAFSPTSSPPPQNVSALLFLLFPASSKLL